MLTVEMFRRLCRGRLSYKEILLSMGKCFVSSLGYSERYRNSYQTVGDRWGGHSTGRHPRASPGTRGPCWRSPWAPWAPGTGGPHSWSFPPHTDTSVRSPCRSAGRPCTSPRPPSSRRPAAAVTSCSARGPPCWAARAAAAAMSSPPSSHSPSTASSLKQQNFRLGQTHYSSPSPAFTRARRPSSLELFYFVFKTIS